MGHIVASLLSRILALYIGPLGWLSWLLQWMRVIVLGREWWFSWLVGVLGVCIQ